MTPNYPLLRVCNTCSTSLQAKQSMKFTFSPKYSTPVRWGEKARNQESNDETKIKLMMMGHAELNLYE